MFRSERAAVQNADDAEQVKAGESRAKRDRRVELEDLSSIVHEPAGRRFMWRLLAHCGTFRSVYGGTADQTTYQAGMQDVGHYLLNEINEADNAALAQMMREAQEQTENA